MELKEIAVVSGKPGLYKIVKPAVNGVILETLDGTNSRFIAGTATKVSVLGEISVYTENGDNIPLEIVFRTIYAKYNKTLAIGSKSTDTELRTFFTDLVPEHDKVRVYTSDIRKIAVWYSVLVNIGFEENFSKKTETAATVAEPVKEKKASKREEVTAETVTPKTEKTVKATADKKEVKEPAEKKAAKAPASKKAAK
jgi:hypothetical protein